MESVEVEERFRALMKEYGNLVRWIIAQMCPPSLGISREDLEQEVQLKLWRALHSEREIANPKSYVGRIAQTAAIDARRRVKTRSEEPLLDAAMDAEHPGRELRDERMISPERHAQQEQAKGMIKTELREFPKESRIAVGLHLQGYGARQIADVTGWTEPKARNLVYRGMRNLREKLSEKGIDCETD